MERVARLVRGGFVDLRTMDVIDRRDDTQMLEQPSNVIVGVRAYGFPVDQVAIKDRCAEFGDRIVLVTQPDRKSYPIRQRTWPIAFTRFLTARATATRAALAVGFSSAIAISS